LPKGASAEILAELQMRIMQLARKASPPPALRVPQTKLEL